MYKPFPNVQTINWYINDRPMFQPGPNVYPFIELKIFVQF